MSNLKINLNELTADSPAFIRIGTIVRSLHDALHDIGANDALAEVIREFPPARERLLHIGELTERAANTVLTKVEEATPIQDKLATDATGLRGEWQAALDAGELPEPLRALASRTTLFMARAHSGCSTTRNALSDIMMSQDFQDLTGQLIIKVVSLIEQTQRDLLNLLVNAAPEGAISTVHKEELMAGPGAPGGVALEQSNVDDLLADLGF
jgi:chemotaxis protein CheZ